MDLKPSSSLRCALAVSAAVCVPLPAATQTLIPDAPSCPTCRVELRDILRLEDSPAAPMAGPPTQVMVDGRGQFWLLFPNDLPLVYSPDGRFLRELGPRGQGPDEYQYPSAVASLPGDSVLIWDRGRTALFVLGPDLRAARTIRFSSYVRSIAVVEWPGNVLVNAALTAAGAPFLTTAMEGPEARVLGAFGGADPTEASGTFTRGLARSGRDTFWSWRPGRYTIEEWSAEGQLARSLERRAPWFPPDVPPLNNPPPPALSALTEDTNGQLWVFLRVPSAGWTTWADAMDCTSTSGGEGLCQVAADAFRTTIEVIDLSTGRVIARTTLDERVVAALPNGRAAVYGTTAIGEPFVRIVEPSLVR